MANATHEVESAVSHFVNDAKAHDFEGLKKDVAIAARGAGQAVNQQYGRAKQLARTNPAATAGIFFGVGALVGAALYAAFRPSPSGYELLKRGLRDSASRARDIFNAGVTSARHAL